MLKLNLFLILLFSTLFLFYLLTKNPRDNPNKELLQNKKIENKKNPNVKIPKNEKTIENKGTFESKKDKDKELAEKEKEKKEKIAKLRARARKLIEETQKLHVKKKNVFYPKPKISFAPKIFTVLDKYGTDFRFEHKSYKPNITKEEKFLEIAIRATHKPIYIMYKSRELIKDLSPNSKNHIDDVIKKMDFEYFKLFEKFELNAITERELAKKIFLLNDNNETYFLRHIKSKERKEYIRLIREYNPLIEQSKD